MAPSMIDQLAAFVHEIDEILGETFSSDYMAVSPAASPPGMNRFTEVRSVMDDFCDDFKRQQAFGSQELQEEIMRHLDTAIRACGRVDDGMRSGAYNGCDKKGDLMLGQALYVLSKSVHRLKMIVEHNKGSPNEGTGTVYDG